MTPSFIEKLKETAAALGMDPVDLTTIISYETAGTFNPTIAGPVTKWGQHRGLIQFGEPQARQYGVKWSDPLNTQLGADGAVVRYFRDHGWKPGMSLTDAYSIVNAGGPGRANWSDAAAGGAPGTVADKVAGMGAHMAKARDLLGLPGGGGGNYTDAIAVETGGSGDDTVAGGESGGSQSDRLGADVAQQFVIPQADVAATYRAYANGEMSPTDALSFETDVLSGKFPAAPPGTVNSYDVPAWQIDRAHWRRHVNAMTPEEARQYDLDLAIGRIPPPDPRLFEGPPPADFNVPDGPAKPDTRTEIDIARSMAAEPAQLTADAWRGATGKGESLTGSRIGDLGMTALGGLGTAFAGAAGLAGDTAEALGMNHGSASRLARDLAAMPEAFAGTPGPLGARAAARSAGIPLSAPAEAAREAAPSAAEIGALVRRASSGGMGSSKAAEELGRLAKVNPEAAAAAERLGIDLPMDVFSDSVMVKQAAGLPRSLAGTEASSQFVEQIMAASRKADEALNEINATPDVSLVSARVKQSLDDARAVLRQQEELLYKPINEAIPRSTKFEMPATQAAVTEALDSVGGKVSRLSPGEKSLYRMIREGDVTYETLMRERAKIGKAIGGGGLDNPYNNASDRVLKRLYGALADDLETNVTNIGGKGLGDTLRMANQVAAQGRALDARIALAFGKDGEGSISSKLISAVKSASNGDVGNLNKVLNVVPEDQRGEAILTAIAAATRDASAIKAGEFGFAKYAKFYSNLRNNSEAYSIFDKNVGPEASGVLRDLYEISKRVTESRANVLTTGKANQELVQTMLAQGIVGKVLNTRPGSVASSVAAGTVGRMLGGAGGAQLAVAAKDSIRAGDAVRMQAIGRLFRNPKFQELVVEAAKDGGVTPTAARMVMREPAFKAWAKAAGIDSPEAWLMAAVSAQMTAEGAEGK